MRHRSEARCLLREIKLMQGLDHPTILGILDLWPGSGDDFSDVRLLQHSIDNDESAPHTAFLYDFAEICYFV